jgi:adenylate cyclase, class 2
MNYEVEQKFPVEDLAPIAARVQAMGAAPGGPQSETDLYFAHPSRDFVQTDEALRIRRKGAASLLTYKGPKVDATTKTRRELELPLGAESDGQNWQMLLEALGFRPVAEVHKTRCKAKLPYQGRTVEVSLDEVAELGTFVELELITPDGELDQARKCIAALAAELGLTTSERRSYLELLLERRKSS